MESMFETYGTVTGVQEALGEHAEHGTCVACEREQRKVYPWPMGGAFGKRCAVCIVKESGGNQPA